MRGFFVSLLFILGVAFIVGFAFGRVVSLRQGKFYLNSYNGVGSTVYKHGTIVRVVDGQPTVVGHFDDDTGKEYPGTLLIEEVK